MNSAIKESFKAFEIQKKECLAWGVVCYQLRQLLKMTNSEFNASKEVRYLCECIEQWGYFEHLRRIALPNYDKRQGLFWDGNEIH